MDQKHRHPDDVVIAIIKAPEGEVATVCRSLGVTPETGTRYRSGGYKRGLILRQKHGLGLPTYTRRYAGYESPQAAQRRMIVEAIRGD